MRGYATILKESLSLEWKIFLEKFRLPLNGFWIRFVKVCRLHSNFRSYLEWLICNLINSSTLNLLFAGDCLGYHKASSYNALDRPTVWILRHLMRFKKVSNSIQEQCTATYKAWNRVEKKQTVADHFQCQFGNLPKILGEGSRTIGKWVFKPIDNLGMLIISMIRDYRKLSN